MKSTCAPHRQAPALLLVLALTACSLVTPRRPPPALHDFGPPPAAASHVGKSVSVTAPPWLQDTRLRYRLKFKDPTQVRFYAHHRWIAPPSELLTARLALLPAPPFYRLQAHLLDFEQVFDTPTCSRIVLRFFIEVAGADGRIVATRLFSFEQLTPSADVEGALAAYAKVVAQAVDGVRAWLDGLAQGNTSTP